MGQKVTGNRELGMASGILLFLILVLFDQATKLLAILGLKDTEGISLIPGVFRLQYLENRGAAFGIFKNMQWIFAVFAIGVIVGCMVVLKRTLGLGSRYFPLQVCMMTLAGGACGNLIDRVFRGYVIDFLYASIIDFPIFNVADICVCVSCGMLIILMLFYYQDDDLKRLAGKEKTK